MNFHLTGKCIDRTIDKRGTISLIVEEFTTGSPVPQKVECYGKAMEAAARAVKRGDTVNFKVTLKASPWNPPGNLPRVWFEKLQATFIEVIDGRSVPPPDGPIDINNDDVPF